MTEKTPIKNGEKEVENLDSELELTPEAQMEQILEAVDDEIALVTTMLESYPESKQRVMERLASYDKRTEKGDASASLERDLYVSFLADRIKEELKVLTNGNA